MEMDEPDRSPSSYFVSMEHSGNGEFWNLVRKILAAANRSVCKFGATLRSLGLKRSDITDSAISGLLQTEGYAFGIFRELDSALIGLDRTGHKTFIFVRDPRDVVACHHLAAQESTEVGPADRGRDARGGDSERSSVSLLDFLRSPVVDEIARQYHQLAEFCRSAENVTLFRYEDAMFSWREVAASLIQKLDLEISAETAFEIADSCKVLARGSPGSGNHYLELPFEFREQSDKAVMAALEEKFGRPMAYFGYVPAASVPDCFLENSTEFFHAISERLAMGYAQSSNLVSRGIKVKKSAATEPPKVDVMERMRALRAAFVSRPIGYSEADPILLWRLRPNASVEMTVLGRRIVISVDSIACRSVVGQPQTGEKTFVAYGCSFTFGTAIPDEETFCSVLQTMFPTWRVENHGVGGYSTLQNLIQLERDSRWSAADYVTFCWIPHHLLRSAGDPSWLQLLVDRNKNREDAQGSLKFPRASLDSDGKLQYRSIKFPRADLLGIDLRDFTPDPYYLDLICFHLLKRAAEVVKQNGGHFFVTTLDGHFSDQLKTRLDTEGIPVVDASVHGREYTCLPDDPHPNALANRIFAEKIRDYLVQLGS